MARLRRLSILFLAFGLFLPLMPHALGFPHDRSCFDFRVGDGECEALGLVALLAAALLRAYVARREGARWRGWVGGGVAFMAVDVFLIPFEIALGPHWYWAALR